MVAVMTDTVIALRIMLSPMHLTQRTNAALKKNRRFLTSVAGARFRAAGFAARGERGRAGAGRFF
jgi:hypothetical protein